MAKVWEKLPKILLNSWVICTLEKRLEITHMEGRGKKYKLFSVQTYWSLGNAFLPGCQSQSRDEGEGAVL